MYLEVIENQTLVSESTNIEYVRSKFAEVEFVGDRTIIALDKTAFRMYTPSKEFPVGTLMKGKIITLATEDYDINGRTVNKITVCVVGDENPIEVANKSLQRNGDDVWVMHNGKSTKPEVKAEDKPAKAEKAAKVK